MKKGILIGLLVLIADQLSKYYMQFHVLSERKFIEISSFLNLVMLKNTGISFSMFAGSSEVTRFVLLGLILAIILWLSFWFYKEKDSCIKLSLGMIIGGAIGNFVDRVVYGGVIDFLDFHIKNYHWPAFNIADSFICIGAVLMLYRSFILMGRGNKK